MCKKTAGFHKIERQKKKNQNHRPSKNAGRNNISWYLENRKMNTLQNWPFEVKYRIF